MIKWHGKHAIGLWTKVMISYPAEDFYQARFLWFLGCQLYYCSMLWKMNVKPT